MEVSKHGPEGQKEKEAGTGQQMLKLSFFFFSVHLLLAAQKGRTQLPSDHFQGLCPSFPNEDATLITTVMGPEQCFCKGPDALALMIFNK